ncbi:metal-dependent hydrolase [Novosphingobium sp. ST904]|uniref:metal-dependent hydrolase n=1 Tax=Novosphingobium sp. ST904 TaxID=1684385 RepID=UPI00210175BB|nr:metal-dependent hydrolase [Novosphingobium sp. ST904]
MTHSLVGWALAETGLMRRSRKGLAACVLAANMPDIDVFFGWSPWAPLAMHRGFTHGLVGGVLLMPPLLAALLWLFDRWQAKRGKVFARGPRMHFGWLVTLCYLGALTHPLLDLQNVYAVQLFSPMSGAWFHTDGLFIIDPWVWIVLGLGIWRRRRSGSAVPAIAALLVVLAYIAANIGIARLAYEAPGVRADRIFAGPEPLAFWRREVIWREGGMIGKGRYDLLRKADALISREPLRPDNMADPLVRRAAAANLEVARFLAWSNLPMAGIERRGCTARVTFRDARFEGPRFENSFSASAEVPTDGPGCAGR